MTIPSWITGNVVIPNKTRVLRRKRLEATQVGSPIKQGCPSRETSSYPSWILNKTRVLRRRRLEATQVRSPIKQGCPSRETSSYPSWILHKARVLRHERLEATQAEMPPGWTVRTLTGYRPKLKRVGIVTRGLRRTNTTGVTSSGNPNSLMYERVHTYVRTGAFSLLGLLHLHCQSHQLSQGQPGCPRSPRPPQDPWGNPSKTTYS